MASGRKYPPLETLERIKAWCALQERAHSDVRTKLRSWGVYGDEAEGIVAELIGGNFLNEARFATAFASGKFRIKKWGWRKIEAGLRQKGISAYSMQAARAVYDEEDHEEVLLSLLRRKRETYKEADPYVLRGKLLRYAASKGYGAEEVHKALDDIID